ncbi:NUDIX domain-containing protein [Streptomyces sp. NPDC059810]|uniref:NUDIX domain-containing protein n=1 Tax=Streptomyces sp. NPDC059810 TaxID=3346956 RepID=UPI003648CFC0
MSIVWGAVAFTDSAGRTLMLRDTSRHRRRLLPGGLADEGETPWDASVRETHEETGLHITGPPRLLAVDALIPYGARAPMVGFMFDGGIITPDRTGPDRTGPDRIRLSNEHDTYLFADPGPGEVPEEQLGRLASLDAARRRGHPLHLHNGTAPGAADE